MVIEPLRYSATVRWTMVAILFLISIVSVLDRHILTLLVVPIKSALQASDVQMSMLLGAAFALPYGVFGIPMGWAADHFQRRKIIAVGVAVFSLSTIASGLGRSYAWLFAARTGVGLGESSLVPTQSSVLSDLFPRGELALATSLVNMGFKAGQGIALLTGAVLTYYIVPESIRDLPFLGATHGWQLIFLIIGSLGLLFVPLIFSVPEPKRTLSRGAEESSSSFGAYWTFFNRNRRFFIAHHLGFLLFVALSVAVTSWTPTFVMRSYGWTESSTGAWLGATFLIAPILGMPLHGAMADYLYRRGWTDIHMRYPMIAAAVACPIGIAAYLAGSPELTAILAGVFLFTISSYASLPLTAVLALMPSRLRGKAASMVTLTGGAGGSILGPLIVGTITDKVFGDPALVGQSIIAAIAVLTPLVCGLFFLTLKPLRTMTQT